MTEDLMSEDLGKLEPDQKEAMLRAVQGMDRIMLLMLLSTGLPLKDLIELRIFDLNLEDGFVSAPSGQRLALSSELLQELKGYVRDRPPRGYLFEGLCGKPVTVKWRRCVLDKLLESVQAQQQDLSPAR
jgi:integrase